MPTCFERERWDLADRLREISPPVLLLWGDADPISPVALDDYYANRVAFAGGPRAGDGG